jgi:hypothetical protein
VTTYMGRTPDYSDAQIADSVKTFMDRGKPMVRGAIKANWPKGYGYRDLYLTADQAEALGLALIRSAERSRAEVAAAADAATTASIRQEQLEAHVEFNLRYNRATCTVASIAGQSYTHREVEQSKAWRNHIAASKESQAVMA